VATREPIRLRQLLRLAIVVFQLCLIALALAGYYLTAVSFAVHMVESLIALLAIAMLHGMAMRWLVLGERRLALKRAEERRDEEPARDDEDLEARPELSPEDEAITLASVNQQTRRLLRAVTALLLGGVLLWVWAEVAPALSYLGHLHAWTTTYQLDGKEQVYEVNLRQLLFATIALMVTWIGTRNLPGLLEIGVLRRLEVDAPTRYAITAVCRYAIVIVGALFGLSLLGLRWSQLQWMAAGLTVGLGFGLQEVFANFVSGLIVLFERPMRVGDVITIAGIEGTVARIRTRATTVVDWDHREVVIPNKTFITEKLTNWTLSDSTTRLVIKLGVGYESDPEAVRTMLLEVARAHPKVLKEPPPNCWCLSLAASTLDFELRVFVAEVLERNAVRNDLHAAILRECRKRGIEIAYPQTEVRVRSLPDPLPQPAPSADTTKASKRD
jgi:potassium efflux system protein